VINLPEVCFGITRQYAKVGSKYLFIFSTKIIYADSPEMENTFYKNITKYLCAIVGTGASQDITHNMSKNWTQRIYIF
jgi:hypothetical protein